MGLKRGMVEQIVFAFVYIYMFVFCIVLFASITHEGQNKILSFLTQF